MTPGGPFRLRSKLRHRRELRHSNGAMVPGIPHVGTDSSGKLYLIQWSGQLRFADITDGTTSTLML